MRGPGLLCRQGVHIRGLIGVLAVLPTHAASGQALPEVHGARVSVPITARAVADAFIQWNGLAQELDTQVRLHLVYGRDSNLYIVYADHQTDVDGRLTQQSRALQTTLAYRW